MTTIDIILGIIRIGASLTAVVCAILLLRNSTKMSQLSREHTAETAEIDSRIKRSHAEYQASVLEYRKASDEYRAELQKQISDLERKLHITQK